MHLMTHFWKELDTVDERIKEHLKHLNKYYLLLADVRKKPYKEFETDAILQGSSERFLHLAIESCLNIGNRLISLYGNVRRNWRY